MQAEATLRQAEIVRWLCAAPAASVRSAGADPAALLNQLRLGMDMSTGGMRAQTHHSAAQVLFAYL